MDTNIVLQGDCLDIMARWPSGQFDLVFADPPFNIGYDYDVYDDRRPAAEYLDWSRQWISAVYRLLKPDGSFWLAIGDEYAADLKVLAQREVGFHPRSWVIWYYTFGVNCKRGFSRSHTHLFHFVKDAEQFKFNAENPAVRVPSARQLVYGDRRANPKGRLPDNTWILRPQDLPDGFGPDEDTWFFSRVAGTFKEREGFHGCQMPEQLLGRIVRICSDPGDIVFDPFAGSGTSLAVAKKLGRRWLGTELSAEYVQRIESRLGAARTGDPLDGPQNPNTSAPTTSQGRRLDERQAKPGPSAKASVRRTDESAPKLLTPEVVRNHFPDTAVDELLCDDQLRQAFLAVCKQEDIKLSPELLLRDLWSQRNLGRKPRRMGDMAWDWVGFAAEIAWQIVGTDTDRDLPGILCHPESTARFDQVAAGLAPAGSGYLFRRAALELLRRRQRQQRAEGRGNKVGRQDAVDSSDAADFPEALRLDDLQPAAWSQPAVYVLYDQQDRPIYAGETTQLMHRLQNLREAPGWHNWRPATLRIWPHPNQRRQLQAELVARLRPALNLAPAKDDATHGPSSDRQLSTSTS